MAAGLGKGLKAGGNVLFKRTEAPAMEPDADVKMHIPASVQISKPASAAMRHGDPGHVLPADSAGYPVPSPEVETAIAPEHISANVQLHKSEDVDLHKVAEVRKHIVLPEPLAERLRVFCFERRAKEAPVVREALDAYLTRHGY